ncbi:hypothetical protein BCR44DRAFT_1428654 [Catenaria anguillulae PL171]|uniref:Uncharacterized protein n=1 Tax=Catenaria anguillulae PL171 TaxID=765915 RepID=A0A1Y2HY30_9FUNG|nr:hypothetical protein BCR44DRAFT_1428654 [Catenaria anguillulae PL171]
MLKPIAMTHSRSLSGSRDSARPPFPAFVTRLDVHNLSTTITQFDLFSILPPHVEPLAVDFSHDPTSVSVSARFSFHALEQALALWNHARHLLAGGYLAHLEASGGESLWFDIDPPIERLVFNFEACTYVSVSDCHSTWTFLS